MPRHSAHQHRSGTRAARPRTSVPKQTGTRGQILTLQQQAGNRAVAAAIQDGRLDNTGAVRSVDASVREPVPVQRGWLSDAATWVGNAARTVGRAIRRGAEAVGRAVRRAGQAVVRGAQWVGDRIGDALDIRENEELLDYQEDRRDLRAWVARGMRGPRNLRAPTGIGGFGAAYDPAAHQLLIRLAGGVNFQDSITFQGNRAQVNHPNPGPLAQTVAQINRLPAAQRRAAAAPFMWTASERTTFITNFNSGVRSRWSGKHEFHATRENWTDQGATVDVDSALHAGAKAAQEHVSLTTYKTPAGGAGNVGVVNSGVGGATDNRMTLNSPDALGRRDNLLRWSGSFAAGSTTLNSAGQTELNAVGATFRGGGPACSICGVTILASTGGPTLTFNVKGATEAEARARYAHMDSVLMNSGNLDIALRTQFNYGGPGNSYEIVAGDGVAQSVSEHEAGHMFGLGDEYATGAGSKITGTGAQAGGEARHNELAQEMGLDGAVFENNDGIMSLGSVVRPQHYSTFYWALGELTGIEWALGPPIPVTRPGPPVGDFPEPAGDTAYA